MIDFCCQPDVPEDSAVLAAERGHPATHNDTNRTVGAPTPRSAPGFTVCPTRSIHVVNVGPTSSFFQCSFQ